MGAFLHGAIPGLLTPLPVAVNMPWFPCRSAGKVADGCKATWTNAQRLPRRGEPPRRSRWGGGESTAHRIKRPRRYTHFGRLFVWSITGLLTPPRCKRWVSSPVHRVPAGHKRLLSTRGNPA